VSDDQPIDVTAVIAPKSDQINADDLSGDMRLIVVVAGVRVVAGEQPLELKLENHPKLYRPCKSMARVLVAAWGKDGRNWRGKAIELYNDPTVAFGGMKTGGLRISRLSHIAKPMEIALTTTRSKRALYKVGVLVKQGAPVAEGVTP
jgi:hypothetical protein